MSTLFATPPTAPKDLRQLLHRKLDEATDEEMAAMHKLLLEMEMQRVLDELDEATNEARAAGRMTPESIAESIAAHRVAHPYR